MYLVPCKGLDSSKRMVRVKTKDLNRAALTRRVEHGEEIRSCQPSLRLDVPENPDNVGQPFPCESLAFREVS